MQAAGAHFHQDLVLNPSSVCPSHVTGGGGCSHCALVVGRVMALTKDVLPRPAGVARLAGVVLHTEGLPV